MEGLSVLRSVLIYPQPYTLATCSGYSADWGITSAAAAHTPAA